MATARATHGLEADGVPDPGAVTATPPAVPVAIVTVPGPSC